MKNNKRNHFWKVAKYVARRPKKVHFSSEFFLLQFANDNKKYPGKLYQVILMYSLGSLRCSTAEQHSFRIKSSNLDEPVPYESVDNAHSDTSEREFTHFWIQKYWIKAFEDLQVLSFNFSFALPILNSYLIYKDRFYFHLFVFYSTSTKFSDSCDPSIQSSAAYLTPICLRISSIRRAISRLSVWVTRSLSFFPTRMHLRISSASYIKPQLFGKLKSCVALGRGQLFSLPSTSIIVVGHENNGILKHNIYA